MNISLEISDAQGHRVEKATMPVVLGRGLASDVQLSDPCVSRRHCRIECLSQESLVLRDLDSKNGTFVDGIRVTEASLRLAVERHPARNRCHIEPLLAAAEQDGAAGEQGGLPGVESGRSWRVVAHGVFVVRVSAYSVLAQGSTTGSPPAMVARSS